MPDSVASLLLRIEGDAGGGERSLRDIAAELAALGQEEANPTVDIDTGGALAQLAALSAEISAVDGRQIDVSVDVDKAGVAGIETATSALDDLSTAAGGSGGGAAVALRSVAFGPFNLGAGQASAIALGLAIAVGVTLVGALAALAASLGGAVAGLGALGVAFAGALGPAVGLVIGAVLRLTKIFEVLKAENAARTQQAQQAAQGDQAAAAAADQRATAVQALADAHQRLREAGVAALREIADAAAAATDAELALERATLSRESAALGIRESERELQKFREETKLTGSAIGDMFAKFTDVNINFDATAFQKALGSAGQGLQTDQELKLERLILNVRDAKLREKEATDGVTDAERNLGRAQSTNEKFRTQGVKASTQYAAALRGVRDAQQQVAVAMRDPAVATGVAKVAALTGQLSATEQRLLGIIRNLRAALNATFGPGVQALLGSVANVLERMTGAVRPLAGVFTLLGRALGGAFEKFAARVTNPAMLAAFASLTLAAAQLAGPVASGMSSLLSILTNIATTAMPTLVTAFQSLAASLLSVSTNTGGIASAVTLVLGHLQTWLSVFGAIANLMLAFFLAAGPQGQQFAAVIAAAAAGLAAWTRSESGRKQIREFLTVAVPLAVAFGRALLQVLVFFLRLGQTVAPALTLTLNLFSDLLSVVNRFIRVLALVEAVANKPFAALEHGIRTVTTLFGGMVTKFTDLGANIVGGFLEGIKSKAGDIIATIKKYITDKVPGFVKKALGIFSPSKVFVDIGQNVTKGLQVGLQAGAQGLGTTAVAALATPVLAAAPVAPRGSGSRQSVTTNAPVTNNVDVSLNVPEGGILDPRTAAEKLGALLREQT